MPSSVRVQHFCGLTLIVEHSGHDDHNFLCCLGSSRFQYEEGLKREPLNYDTWFDYIKLEESSGDHERTREVGAITQALSTSHSTSRKQGTRRSMCKHASFPMCVVNQIMLTCRCMSVRSPICHLAMRSGIGSGTSTCGSSMRCGRSWRQGTWTGHAKCTGNNIYMLGDCYMRCMTREVLQNESLQRGAAQ